MIAKCHEQCNFLVVILTVRCLLSSNCYFFVSIPFKKSRIEKFHVFSLLLYEYYLI